MDFEMLAYKRYAAVGRYTGSDADVTIPSTYKGLPVTQIREGAFAQNDHIRHIAIPRTLETVGAGAFENCRNLRLFTCGADLQDYFADPKNHLIPALSVLPESLKTIETRAFAGSGIQNLQFHANLLTLEDSAFEACENLKSVGMGHCNELTLGKSVFQRSAIAQFFAPNLRMDKVPDYTFAYCKDLHTVTACIHGVGLRSFYQCSQLKRIEQTKQIVYVGAEAFYGCEKLEGVRLPKRASRKTKPKPPAPPVPDPGQELEQLARRMMLERLTAVCRQIERKARGEEAALAQEVKSTRPGKQILLSLESTIPGKVLTAVVKGTPEDAGEQLFLRIQVPSQLRDVQLRFVEDANLEALRPLILYVLKQNMQLTLLGDVRGSRLDVYEILPLSKDLPASLASRTSQNISVEFLHELLNRLRSAPPVDTQPSIVPYTMTRQEEFDAFVEICGSRLPGWLVDAYHRNRDITMQSTGFGSDEKKHALQAQKLLLNIDWSTRQPNVPPMAEARKILDDSFHGLDMVKERILEVVAQIRRTGTLPKWGILLHGPAGTGKTTIAKAVGKLLDLPLIQIDISTLRENADHICGSPRIYSNARQGKLINDMYTHRTSTNILLANEVDKDSHSTLLTILDKTGFEENFLEEVIPTDNLFCIGTCNELDKLSKPLLDRFLIIHIPAYSAEEKGAIWRKHVLPAALARSRVDPGALGFTQEAARLLIHEYAREPGARDLEQYAERFIGDFCRRADGAGKNFRHTYTAQEVKAILGPTGTVTQSFAVHPGQVNAAFFHDGSAHFFMLEATVLPGRGRFRVLGPLGPLQTEYCEAAYWAVRNTTTCDLSKYDVTIFVPRAIPDTPDNQVGLACYAAICSRLLGRQLALKDLCFVGGCDLNGNAYFDCGSLSPFLRAMGSAQPGTLYVPMGAAGLVTPRDNPSGKTVILEAQDARTLFTLAVTQSLAAG